MNYECVTKTIGHNIAKVVHKPGQPLYGFTSPGKLSLKPDTYERALNVLNYYQQYIEENDMQMEFTPDPNHARYGLSDDFFWIRKGKGDGAKWGLVKAPIKDGDTIFVEK